MEWIYREISPNDDVLVNLPVEWHLRLFKILSGDSGKTYYVSLLQNRDVKDGRMIWCDCWPGKTNTPLTILGLTNFACKHATNLLAYLEQQKANRKQNKRRK